MRNFFTSLIIVFVGIFCFWTVFAEDNFEEKPDFSAFKSVDTISELDILVPKVVDIPISFESNANREVLVVEEPEGAVIPTKLLSDREKIKITAKDSLDSFNLVNLIDNDNKSYIEYSVSESGMTENVQLDFYFQKKVSLSSISFQLDSHVALPETIELKTTGGNNEEKIIVAKRELNSRLINFPEIFSDNLSVKLEYVQPLRIREVGLGFNESELGVKTHLRYLAQPGKDYSVYYNADRYVDFDEGESPDLLSDDGVKYLSVLNPNPNSLFVKADIDEDGVFDEIDNCVLIKNSDQEDLDSNGRGDACDDFDRDGVINSDDNCPNNPNRNQGDEDLDRVGDVCDDQESRFLQTQTWLPIFLIVIVLIVTGGLIIITVKRK